MSFAQTAAYPKSWTPVLTQAVVFFCFLVSGFSSLLYQVLWTRLAFAHFGVIIQVLSITVSTFMLGLGLGATLGGRWVAGLSRGLKSSPLLLYAGAECCVAAGAFAVPALLRLGNSLLLTSGAQSSGVFLLLSGLVIVLALLPWCIAMGATIPLMMAYLRLINLSAEGFSLLYIANVLGAAAGAALTAIALIELFGLHGTDMVGASGNLCIAVMASATAFATGNKPLEATAPKARGATPRATPNWLLPALFFTGFSSLGLEMCWARDFTYQLRTSIYAFAAILVVYLLATCLGSRLQKAAHGQGLAFERLSVWLFPFALLPLFVADPRGGHGIIPILFSIVPLCGLLGYTTPGLVDRFAQGDPRQTGWLYAINIMGGVLGPLAAGYLLLPLLGLRLAMLLLAAPLAAASLFARGFSRQPAFLPLALSVPMLAAALAFPRGYDEGSIYPAPYEVHRDYAAAVIAYGTGMKKHLSVNGINVTDLTTITKVMAHLPMALQGHPRSALDICFGMGTTFRALASWGVPATAVDLSPAVIASFSFFHADAAKILANPIDHTVADDGRRFLTRTSQSYDVITIDPPPPVGASGSSLLYSENFYTILKRRLNPGGILAQWVPRTEAGTLAAIALSLHQSFPYMRVFVEGGRNFEGVHFIASMTPIPELDAAAFVRRMPPAAIQDLLEWQPQVTPRQAAQNILGTEIPLADLLPQGSTLSPVTDDRPMNEYFLLRTGIVGSMMMH